MNNLIISYKIAYLALGQSIAPVQAKSARSGPKQSKS